MPFLNQADDPAADAPDTVAPTDESPGGEPQSMSLMGGIASGSGADGGDPLGLEPSAKPKKLSSTTLSILALVVISAGALLAMKMTAGPQAADASTQQFVAEIDSAIQKLKNPQHVAADDPLQPQKLQELFRQPEEIIAAFDVDHTDKHVPLEDVQKNPFRFGTPERKEVDPEAERLAKEAELMRQKAEQIKKLRAAFAKLKLQSVMNGPNPVAVINGEFLRVGSSVEGFQVVQIEQLKVTLEAEDHRFELSVKR